MNLQKLHKRLAIQAMNPNDPLAENKAKSVRWVVDGRSVSLKRTLLDRRKKQLDSVDKIEVFDKDGNLKQKIK